MMKPTAEKMTKAMIAIMISQLPRKQKSLQIQRIIVPKSFAIKPEISKWLSRAKNDASGTLAFCKVCGCTIQARLATIRVHGKSSKHLAMMKITTGTSKVHQKYFTLKWPPADYGSHTLIYN